jgi:hypothetical protein
MIYISELNLRLLLFVYFFKSRHRHLYILYYKMGQPQGSFLLHPLTQGYSAVLSESHGSFLQFPHEYLISCDCRNESPGLVHTPHRNPRNEQGDAQGNRVIDSQVSPSILQP